MSKTPRATSMKSTFSKVASVAARVAGIAALVTGFFQGSCFAAALGAQPAPDTFAVADCNWNHPGANPFMGDVVAAVDRYQDIAPAVRARLKARMAKRDYDEVVEIRRDSIAGRNDYGSEIADMHFGTRQLCHRVTRAAWSAQMQERGLVYCEQDQCLLVPTICRNVSRIQRRAVHNEPMHAIFVPGPAAGFAPGSEADDAAVLLPAGPIGWAPGGSVGSSVIGVSGGAAGLAFTQAGGGSGGLGGGMGGAGGGAVNPRASRADAAYALVDEPSGPRQSAKIVSVDTDRPASVGIDQATIAAPVPEPQTWALMAVGLLTLLRVAARRRRKPSQV